MFTRSIFIAMLVAAVVSPAFCLADVRFDETEVDLGEVRAGIRLNGELALTNAGKDVATIQEVRGSCGCLVAQVEPAAFSPGERGKLRVQLNTLGEGAGPHSWKAVVRYRQAGEDKQVEATFRARLVTEITVQPASLTLVTGGGISQSIVLTDHREKPLNVKNVAASASWMKCRLVKQGKDSQACWTARMALDIDRDVPEGRHDAVLSIYSDDPLYGELRVPVVVVKAAPATSITADPPSIQLTRHEQSSRLVRLRSARGQAIQVEKVDADHPALTCKWAHGPGQDLFLKITANLTATSEAPRRMTVRVHLTAPVREVVTIPVLLESDEHETAER